LPCQDKRSEHGSDHRLILQFTIIESILPQEFVIFYYTGACAIAPVLHGDDPFPSNSEKILQLQKEGKIPFR
jgi:hypothetical protein